MRELIKSVRVDQGGNRGRIKRDGLEFSAVRSLWEEETGGLCLSQSDHITFTLPGCFNTDQTSALKVICDPRSTVGTT